MDLIATHGAQAVLLPCLVLWSQLYTLGLFNESRSYAVHFKFAGPWDLYIGIRIMANKKTVNSGAEWESLVAYCRAVRVGPHIAVSGCAPVGEDGALVAPGDMYAQSVRCIEIIASALKEAGGTLTDVVRTRIFVTDIDRWDEVARAHREAFADITPACSMVEVSRLIGPDMLVEIEADAIVE